MALTSAERNRRFRARQRGEYVEPIKRTGRTPTVLIRRGQRFGRLVVIDPQARTEPGTDGRTVRAAVCRCDCGAELTTSAYGLVRGHAKSCGCLQRDQAGERMRAWIATPGNLSLAHMRSAAAGRRRPSPEQLAALHAATRTHGLSRHPLFSVWLGMIDRCEKPGHEAYANYGGRGITVCPEWHDVAMFIDWVEANIGPRPDGKSLGGRPLYTLDRIDNDGDYEPGNIRWATAKEQRANQRR